MAVSILGEITYLQTMNTAVVHRELGVSSQNQRGKRRKIPLTLQIIQRRFLTATKSGVTQNWQMLRRVTGAEVGSDEPTQQPFFNAKGQIIQVNGTDVQVFIFADETTRKAATYQISPDSSSTSRKWSPG